MTYEHFTDGSFQTNVLESNIPVLVDFWAEWCPPCKIISPLIDELAQEYEGKVVIGKLNTDENTVIPGEYNVMSIPTVLIFKDGKPVQSMVGAHNKKAYTKAIEDALNS